MCDIYLRITCNDVPNNEDSRMHMVRWVRGLLNLPFQRGPVDIKLATVRDSMPSREYKVEEVKVNAALIVS